MWLFEITCATCQTGFNYQCVHDRLNATDSDTYYDLTSSDIESLLAPGVNSDGRKFAVVRQSNVCDRN